MSDLAAAELEGRRFSCLEGCGFCCTFQPEASGRELALLRARLAPRALPVSVGADRTYLALQNACGACTLLSRRGCEAYDLRPAHCRYFPFHVHFGARPEVYVNYTCRGVVVDPAGRLHDAYAQSVTAHARADDWAEHARAGVAAYAEFQRRARRAGAWGDARAVAAKALEGAVFTRAWMERAAREADEDVSPDDLVADALLPFSAEDVTKRPFYLADDLRWLTFDGPEKLVEMDEQGALHPVRSIAAPLAWADLDADVAAGLQGYLRQLVERDLFTGSVYAVVDDMDYDTTVEQATWWRLAEIAADLAVRARVLAAKGTPRERLVDETARFYDSTFLDSATIGGFL